MNKSELIEAVATKADVSKATVNRTLDALAEVLKETLVKPGDKVRILGVASFEVKHQEARTARNPLNGETVQVAAKDVVKAKSLVK
jgi:DNA-binding protein HU-beta